MKLFTIKDFIHYNNPCFNCNNITSLYFNYEYGHPDKYQTSIIGQAKITPSVDYDSLDVTLKVSYESVLRMKIFATHNTFLVTNKDDFISYASSRKIHLENYCDVCHSSINSHHLLFNNNIIKPLSINSEILTINNQGKKYIISSDFDNKISQISLNDKLLFISPNLISLSNLKNKKAILNKIKSYSAFL